MNNPLADRLERISVELAQLADSLRDSKEPVVFPDEAAAKLAKRICLQCGKEVQPDERYIRGLCTADHQLTLGRIKTGASEGQLITLGLLAPRTSGGRKPRKTARLDQMIAELDMLPTPDKYSEANARRIAHKFAVAAEKLGKKSQKKSQEKKRRKSGKQEL